MTPSKPRLPRRKDLPVRYTVETCVYYRVWDELAQEYIDDLSYYWIHDEGEAQKAAKHMEESRS